MSDITDKVTALLGDPSSLEKIMSIAQGMAKPEEPKTELPIPADKIAPMLEAYTKSADNPKIRLLLALKPMLSEGRQKNIDEAISMMKLAGVASKLFERGEADV